MQNLITAQFIRRGFQLARQGPPDGNTLDAEQQNNILQALQRLRSPGSIAVLATTTLVFLIISIVVEYSLRFVIGNLAIVENVMNESPLEFELDDLLNEDEDDGEVEVPGGKKGYARVAVDDDGARKGEITHVLTGSERKTEEGRNTTQALPITRNLQTAIRHLRSIGGIRSLFRGFKAYLVVLIIFLGITIPLDLLVTFSPRSLTQIISITAASMVVTPLHCTWTHATIRANRLAPTANSLHSSPPRGTGWWRYVPGIWSRYLVLPAIRLNITTTLFSYSTKAITLAVAAGLPRASLHPAIVVALCLLAPLLFTVVVGLLAVIPAVIALARVEASLLPESEQAVVPFDRTFGARSVSWQSKDLSCWRYVAINLGPVGAWKMFDREAYFRVTAVYVKFMVLTVVLVVLYLVVLGFELYAILGDQVEVVMVIIAPLLQDF